MLMSVGLSSVKSPLWSSEFAFSWACFYQDFCGLQRMTEAVTHPGLVNEKLFCNEFPKEAAVKVEAVWLEYTCSKLTTCLTDSSFYFNNTILLMQLLHLYWILLQWGLKCVCIYGWRWRAGKIFYSSATWVFLHQWCIIPWDVPKGV